MQLERLIAALAPEVVLGQEAVAVQDLAYDTRAVTPGALFFGVPGAQADGHDFAGEAVERGAAALVVERDVGVPVPQLVVADARAAMAVAADAFFGEPTKELEVAGVTGTNGKTTTAFLLHAILDAAGRRPGLLGTVESRVGGQVRPVVRTTPEAIDLQRTFREMLDAGDRSVALEASSHASVLGRLDRVRFDVLVFTNLTQDHLDFHGSMDDYYAAKRRLFVRRRAAARGGQRRRRVRAAARRGAADAGRAPLVTFGFADDAEIRPERARPRRHRRAPHRGRDRAAHVACAGASTSRTSSARSPPGSCSTSATRRSRPGSRLSTGVPGRFETIDEGQPFTVLVDYAHTPDSLDNVLRTARDFADGRVLVVFGAGGDRDRGKRPLMGRVAADLADVVLVTSDNPRSEEPLAIIQDILQGTGMDVEIDPDRRSAIERAVSLAEPGDVVVIAGKGHEQGQEIGAEKLPFDDREVAREALRA